MAEELPASNGRQPLTRRVFARRVGSAVLAAPFLPLLDGVALARPAVSGASPLEQHIDPGVRIRSDNGAEVVVPPVYHEIITARVKPASGRALLAARDELGQALQHIEQDTSSGRAA